MKQILVLITAVAALAACSEQTQTINSGNRPDAAALNLGMAFDKALELIEPTAFEPVA